MPSITIEDVDDLCHHRERPEDIRRFEQTVGRRVRMDDGKELLIMGSPPDFDDDEG